MEHIGATHSTFRITPQIDLSIREYQIFPHLHDGLRQWEAGIVFTRYLESNRHLVQGKNILELGCGTGLTGIFISKYCGPKQLILNDYNAIVLDNARHNLRQNGQHNSTTNTLLFDWRQYHKDGSIQKRLGGMEVVLASDIIYDGTPMDDLIGVVGGCLVKGGLFLVQISNQRHKKQPFIKQMEQSGLFSMECIDLDPEQYQSLPVVHQIDLCEQQYPGMGLQFQVLLFRRI